LSLAQFFVLKEILFLFTFIVPMIIDG
jgi:hypothetical protein